mmetsp:Transcript_47463/g.90627  ORF Transcript_47463/g.90627 Transcript_47463/m.90627 type:complete len:219 (+) Transcript_47463:167-823(+)
MMLEVSCPSMLSRSFGGNLSKGRKLCLYLLNPIILETTVKELLLPSGRRLARTLKVCHRGCGIVSLLHQPALHLGKRWVAFWKSFVQKFPNGKRVWLQKGRLGGGIRALRFVVFKQLQLADHRLRSWKAMYRSGTWLHRPRVHHHCPVAVVAFLCLGLRVPKILSSCADVRVVPSPCSHAPHLPLSHLLQPSHFALPFTHGLRHVRHGRAIALRTIRV